MKIWRHFYPAKQDPSLKTSFWRFLFALRQDVKLFSAVLSQVHSITANNSLRRSLHWETKDATGWWFTLSQSLRLWFHHTGQRQSHPHSISWRCSYCPEGVSQLDICGMHLSCGHTSFVVWYFPDCFLHNCSYSCFCPLQELVWLGIF